jgi:uncharacterized protein YciI
VRGVSASHALLLYDYLEDVLERRAPYRDQHLEVIGAWKDSGRLLMAGPLGDPPTGAAFVFQVDDPAEVDEFVASDPYVSAGIVIGHRVQGWKLV